VETRYYGILLTLFLLLGIGSPTYAQSLYAVVQDSPPILEPEVDRREIKEADIDSENIELSVFTGFVSIEDFGSDSIVGARLGYHITENIFMEASYGAATAGTTSFEELSGGAPFLTDEERDFIVYDLVVGYNFNNELFITEGWVFNSDFYLLAGAGATEFGGDERFTATVGAGYRVLLTDFLSLRFDVRDHIFNSDLIGEEKSTHNIAYSLGISVFF
jgi:outer membrane beta-barrel protein